MQVKEHIQALVDENFIRVEKIGSGNWYWSFPSEVQLRKEEMLQKVLDERDKISSAVAELQHKVDEANAEREAEENSTHDDGYDRTTLNIQKSTLQKELEAMRAELSGYSETDPFEVERRRENVAQSSRCVDQLSDQIIAIECWIKANACDDKEQFQLMKRNWYGVDYDEEEGGLKEL